MNEKRKNALLTVSVWLTLGGALLAFGPLLLALVLAGLTGDVESAYDEGDGFGSLMWLMFVTLPVGGITAIVGLILLVVSAIRALRKPRP